MEVKIDVEGTKTFLQQKIDSNMAYFTFVALDKDGQPHPGARGGT